MLAFFLANNLLPFISYSLFTTLTPNCSFRVEKTPFLFFSPGRIT
jgi:hypothetical protein